MTTYYVSYCRVSTAKQGASGLGLEAQQATVRDYVEKQGGELLREFVEVESGSHNDRTQLAAALHHCDLTGAVLLVAKLDRLSRDLHFITSLQKSGIAFVVCDFPDANSFTIHIFAALAQYERELISQRTKQALTAARVRGQRLGTPGNLSAAAADAGRRAGRASGQRRSAEFADKLRPLVEQYRAEGLTLRAVADRLAADRIQTASGGYAWTPTAVQRVLAGSVA